MYRAVRAPVSLTSLMDNATLSVIMCCVQFCAAQDKIRLWIELESIADHFTVVPTFVTIYYDRNWLGVCRVNYSTTMFLYSVVTFFDVHIFFDLCLSCVICKARIAYICCGLNSLTLGHQLLLAISQIDFTERCYSVDILFSEETPINFKLNVCLRL